MQRFIAASLAATALTFAFSAVPALAAGDPTMHEIYEAAQSGHLDQAQQMMDQVLRDHPESSVAHYVQAELFAREGHFPQAKAELGRAEQLDPGLTKENPRSVAELKAQLGMGPRLAEGAMAPRVAEGGRPYAGYAGVRPVPVQPHFPWMTIVILALVVGVFWMLFRRRNTYVQYPSGGVPGGAPGAYGPGGYVGPGGGMGGGGIGSSIAGGLAGGLAAGAGLVAGEELAHHFLDGDRSQGVIPPANAGEWNNNAPQNGDMGGSDFGVNDPGSWGDSGGGDFGGGGGGGDDWT